ncbi:hypothetical protein [Actibacterium sp. MT2.3-13A]|uniref:hypothetical protein n=1 Tax=Actibacterium sp. MT2.3-13A TaxID=2828332 RepID=UPI001BA720A4|nr:hypothetical protein [Actibacterium sp. MT2.3-13A]
MPKAGQPSTARAEPTLAEKVRFLSSPDSYAPAPTGVEAIETHMSWVFLAGERVYKLKKPLRRAFLDLHSLERRAANVRAEIRLNRRLAPQVYLGARALRQAPDGALALDGTGRIVEWLVEMRRLPEDATLKARIRDGRARRADVARVAETLIAFYAGLPGRDLSAETVIAHYEAEHARSAAVLSDPQFGLDAGQVGAALDGFDAAFGRARPLLRARVDARRFVEGHGDLRPEHVFLTEPLAIIDCLEFSEMLRTIDPFEEIVFLGLECAQLGAGWVLALLRDRLAAGLDDRPPPALLAFYWRYRALLRARFALLHLTEPVIRTPAKWRPLAQAYIALSQEAEIRTRPPEDR